MMRRRMVLALAVVAAGLKAQTLQVGKTAQGEVAVGQARSYAVRVEAGQFARVSVTQPVAATLEAPDGNRLLAVDTATFSKPLLLVWVAETSGDYRIRVSGAGHYEIQLEELRAATPDDARRADAERLFNQGLDELHRYAYDAATATFTRALSLYRDLQNREREADSLEALGIIEGNRSHAEKAIGFYEQVLAVRRAAGDRHGESIVFNELSAASLALSRNDQARGYSEQALMVAREANDPQAEGAAATGLGNIYYRESDYQKAIGYFERAATIFHEAGSRRREGKVLVNIGNVYYQLSQYEQSIGFLEQAMEASRAAGDRGNQGFVLLSLGNAYDSLSQFDQARDYYQQSLAIAREVHDRRGEGLALGNVGLVYKHLSQYAKAIEFYTQNLVIAREVKDRQGEGGILTNIGNAYMQLGQYDTAIGIMEQAVAIAREVKDRFVEELNLSNLGACYRTLGQHEKAISSLEQALAIQRDLQDRADEGVTLCSLGEAYDSLNQFSKAMGYFGQALSIAREVKDRMREAIALNGLGDAEHGLGRDNQAMARYAEALAISRQIQDRGGEAGEFNGLMNACQAFGRPRLAVFYGKQAVNTLQSIRADISGLGRELQQSFLKGNEKPYHTLAEILIAEGRLGEAEQVMALLKEEEYFQYIRRAADEAASLKRRADLNPDEAAWEKSYREIGDRLMAVGVEHGELVARAAKKNLTPEEQQRLARLEQDLSAGNQAFEHFLGDLNAHFSAKPEVNAGVVEKLREDEGFMADLRELPAGTVAIYALAGEDAFHAILETPNARKPYEYRIKAADLYRKVFEFRQAVIDPHIDPRPLAQELYRILIGPMAADLRQAKARTLMWELDGPLRYLPIAALYDGKQYLLEQYRVSVMTLASEARLKDQPGRTWRAAGFGVTKPHEDVAALPEVASEMAGVARILHGEVKLDEQFTEASLRATLLKRYPVVHIASHFRFQPGDQAQSFLLLGDGGHLSLAELKTMPNLFGGVELLTLSACNTGLGDGSEVEGFGTLAQRKGAKAVVASLWPVADESTSQLMQEFYRIRESSRGMTKLEALRQAQLKLLHGDGTAAAPHAHPFYWAPFFLMGNWL